MITAANNPGQDGGRAVGQIDSNPSSTAHAQRVRLLDRLQRRGPLTTLDARLELDVLHPAMRILELRKLGHDIRTVWVQQSTAAGKVHRVGKYQLFPQVAQ